MGTSETYIKHLRTAGGGRARQPLSCVPSIHRPCYAARPSLPVRERWLHVGPPIKLCSWYPLPPLSPDYRAEHTAVQAVKHSLTLNSRLAIRQVCPAISMISHVFSWTHREFSTVQHQKIFEISSNRCNKGQFPFCFSCISTSSDIFTFATAIKVYINPLI